MPRERSSSSIALIGSFCCGYTAGSRLRDPQQSRTTLIVEDVARCLSAGPLIVAEFPDHATFDHDRALSALFAGDHAGRGAGQHTSSLLHFGRNGLDGPA